MATWVIFGIIAVLLLFIVQTYNTLVVKRNVVENAFGGMDVQLKKRYDLIPNLVATVEKFMTHEKDLFTEVTALRARATSGGLSTDEKVNLDNQISQKLGGIMVAIENYPQLKSDQNVNQLQRTLNEVEEQISAARRTYNAAVTDFNNSVEMFPSNIVASVTNFKRRQVFEVPETQRENPDVNKLFND